MSSRKYLTTEFVSRDSQNTLFRFLNILPNPDKILRNTGKTIETYRDLKNDPHVWSCIQSRKSGVLSLEYNIMQNNAPNSTVKEITKIIGDLDLQQIERDILEAPLFGYQPLEILWDVTQGSRKYIIPKDVVAKPQEWFFYNNNGELKFRKSGEPKGVEPPPMKIINVQYEPSFMNPYGQALLAKCYWPVTFKNGGIRFWVNFTEKYGMPILLGHYTRGASNDESQRLADELSRLSEDSVIVAPSDIDLQLHEAVRTSSVNLYKELIKNCNGEISKAILSQTLTTELETGSYAASQTHYKIRKEVILSDIRLVESVINKIIKFIVELNFGTIEAPKFNMIINDSENTQKIDRDLKISQTGAVRFTKSYWINNYGLKEEEINEV